MAISGMRRKRYGNWLVRWALAAAALLLIGAGMYVVLFSTSVQAAPDVFDRLLDWNVALTEAPLADRLTIYRASAGELHSAAASPDLSAEDLELAQALLANADSLTKNADPLAEAERLSAVADKLLQRIDGAAKNRNHVKLGKFARHYGKVARAIGDSLDDAEFDDSLPDAQQQRLLTLSQREQNRQTALAALIASAPAAEQKIVRSCARSNASKEPQAQEEADVVF